MPHSPSERGLRERLLLRTQDDVGAMQSALVAAEFATIVQKAHRLAGAAGALGFEALGAIGHALEREATAADSGAVRARLQALARELDHAFARLGG